MSLTRSFVASVVLMAFSCNAVAQDCNGTYSYKTAVEQACTRINGTLSIEGDVADLSGLSRLEQVSGSLLVETTKVKSLSGLGALRTVGSLRIYDNDNLLDVSALSSLRYVQGTLEIRANRNLPRISDFSSLEAANSIQILGNASLVSIGPFPLLEQIQELLFIEHNTALETVDGFVALKRVKRIQLFANIRLVTFLGLDALEDLELLTIGAHPSLQRVGAFPRLTKLQSLQVVGASLLTAIGPFPKLEALKGNVQFTEYGGLPPDTFPVLRSIEGSLFIRESSSQKDMRAFGALAEIGVHFSLSGNTQLKSLEGLERLTSIGQNLTVSFNSCDVQNGCGGTFTLGGLNGLTSIGRSILIDSNINLRSVAELGSVRAVGHHVEIIRNSDLCGEAARQSNKWGEIALVPDKNQFYGNGGC
jgi:Receptor L domain